ncbi:aspartyl-phosphate phosphatase Spo0E family protein [Neobacillus drentensis]|uniref:aspartyl-phosphate phosphatase Spo0E family protein n=1 Tax=Neobacillus drentensis TaxID=220684 RepID=UPI003000ACB8
MDRTLLRLEIESLRNKLISVGMSEGFTASETLELSKNLDELLNLQIKVEWSQQKKAYN